MNIRMNMGSLRFLMWSGLVMHLNMGFSYCGLCIKGYGSIHLKVSHFWKFVWRRSWAPRRRLPICSHHWYSQGNQSRAWPHSISYCSDWTETVSSAKRNKDSDSTSLAGLSFPELRVVCVELSCLWMGLKYIQQINKNSQAFLDI